MNTPEPTDPTSPPARRPLTLALQVLGFCVSIGLLVYCVRAAVTDQRAIDRLKDLAHASALDLACLLGLSGVTIACAGLVFAEVIRPVRRLPRLDVIATSALCTLLGNVPMKASLFARIAIHNRRDGVPLLTIGAWMAMAAGMILLSLVSPVGASLLLRRVDGMWWALTLGGTLVLGTLACVICRSLASDRGWDVLQRLLALPRIPALVRLGNSQAFEKLHAGTDMIAHPRTVVLTLLWRGIDTAAQAARFALAAKLTGVALSFDQTVIAGCCYFFLQAIAPAGALGFREAGVGGVLLAATSLAKQDLLAVILTVSVAETCVNLVLGPLGAAYLRVDRLFFAHAGAKGTTPTPLPQD